MAPRPEQTAAVALAMTMLACRGAPAPVEREYTLSAAGAPVAVSGRDEHIDWPVQVAIAARDSSALVVWTSRPAEPYYLDSGGSQIRARLLRSSGSYGEPIDLGSDASFPEVVALGDDEYAVAWRRSMDRGWALAVAKVGPAGVVTATVEVPLPGDVANTAPHLSAAGGAVSAYICTPEGAYRVADVFRPRPWPARLTSTGCVDVVAAAGAKPTLHGFVEEPDGAPADSDLVGAVDTGAGVRLLVLHDANKLRVVDAAGEVLGDMDVDRVWQHELAAVEADGLIALTWVAAGHHQMVELADMEPWAIEVPEDPMIRVALLSAQGRVRAGPMTIHVPHAFTDVALASAPGVLFLAFADEQSDEFESIHVLRIDIQPHAMPAR